jgi:hypothetical protein
MNGEIMTKSMSQFFPAMDDTVDGVDFQWQPLRMMGFDVFPDLSGRKFFGAVEPPDFGVALCARPIVNPAPQLLHALSVLDDFLKHLAILGELVNATCIVVQEPALSIWDTLIVSQQPPKPWPLLVGHSEKELV